MSESLPRLVIAVDLAVIIIHFNRWRLPDEQRRHNGRPRGCCRRFVTGSARPGGR